MQEEQPKPLKSYRPNEPIVVKVQIPVVWMGSQAKLLICDESRSIEFEVANREIENAMRESNCYKAFFMAHLDEGMALILDDILDEDKWPTW